MTALSRRAFLASASAIAVSAALPQAVAAPVAPVVAAVKPLLPTWIVGTPGEWDHEIIRAVTREAAILLRCEECEDDGDDPDCTCGACIGRGGYEATRVSQWDGRPIDSIENGDWLDAAFDTYCNRCGYEVSQDSGRSVSGKAVCECCMTLADWEIADPEHAAELREIAT